MTNKENGADTAVVDTPEAQTADPANEATEPPFPIRVAIIDDGVAVPSFDLFDDPSDAQSLLEGADDLDEDLSAIGAERDGDPAVNLAALIESGQRLGSLGELAENSDAFRARWDDYLFHRSLRGSLQSLVAEVISVDPSQGLPDLSVCEVIFLDYYLEDPSKGPVLAEEIARQLIAQPGRSALQQIILMSNRENVARERRTFRKQANIRGASFAFVPKKELSSRRQIYSHLAVLDRARPMAPKIDAYHDALTSAVKDGARTFLELVDELDIDDYAHLQNVALMKDGDPLGEYIATLFAAELASRTVEADEVRTAERGLDKTEFERKPFASTEPSTIVKQLYHSALICSNMGELGDHPRAAPDSDFAGMPLVRMGDLFFSSDKERVVAILSADCDLAFAPNEDRPPNPDTAVLLVPGTTEKLAGAGKVIDAITEGFVDGDEVFRIHWAFSSYRSVALKELKDYLKCDGYDVKRRDRLRAPFSFRLQQEFGANLFRVGAPAMPPMTREASASIKLFCKGEVQEQVDIDDPQLRLTSYGTDTCVRLGIADTEKLYSLCETLSANFDDEIVELSEGLADLNEGQRKALEKKIFPLEKQRAALDKKLSDDLFWHELHGDHPIARKLTALRGIAKLVLGDEWDQEQHNQIILHVYDPAKPDPGQQSTADK